MGGVMLKNTASELELKNDIWQVVVTDEEMQVKYVHAKIWSFIGKRDKIR